MNAEIINKILKFLGSQAQNVKWNSGVTLNKDGREYHGVAGVLSALGSEENDRLQRSLMYQWAEAAQLWEHAFKEGGNLNKQILQEIDEYLEGCSYFVGYSRSLADVLMYHLLYRVLEGLSPNERRQVPCVCRWFNHIQQEATLRQDNPLINFSSSFLTPTSIQPLSY